MRSVVEIGATVPAFLGKLWKLVNDTETNHLISWSPVSIFGFILQNSFLSIEASQNNVFLIVVRLVILQKLVQNQPANMRRVDAVCETNLINK